MKKVALSLIVAGSLAFGFTTGDAEASSPASQSVSVNNGTYTTAHNVNIRSGAGTGNKIVLLAKKGTEVSVVGQRMLEKKFGITLR
ncbi:hypothetical protein QNH10_18545 [Sporosarcina thermotolerans]|uniref:hypothetical protein n=1 Tax=Sporosarcina thermotolerans TaxID=633404 RepID=UPI0024BD11A3|nr:hypothetical protein [Sporosarcina thermotolerans]WHT48019.1 hypothetical protein QNH10_18545 [Sporosarcina thermotolerans]